MKKPLINIPKETTQKGKAEETAILFDEPVYYLFTTQKDSDIAISKTPSIKLKMFPFVDMKGKRINKRKKYYTSKEINDGIENDDPYYEMFESIIYDDAHFYDYENPELNNYAQLTDGHHTAQTHYFLKIYDRSNIMRFLYYLNNHKGLYKKIKATDEKTLYFEKKDFIVFFSLDKDKDLPKSKDPLKKLKPKKDIDPPCIFPVINYRYEDKELRKMIVIHGKYETMRELLEEEGNTEKIKRLDSHKESSRAYRESQAEKEDEKRARGERAKLIDRKRRKYNRPK